MPDKEGSDEKSTKSVVSKKQKQMMGEEGYDIARDMGRVRPSKDKKDATTMPVSDEVRKTQKVNKGPSALDIVKKKYKGQIMNVGKKKANEELDLTQVAEAFGGYLIEQDPPTYKDLMNTQNNAEALRKKLQNKKKSGKSDSELLNGKEEIVQQELELGNMKTTNTPISTKRTLKGRPLGSKNKPKDIPSRQVTLDDLSKQKPEPEKSTATRADYPKTRSELEAKRKEYGIDQQGRVSDAGVEKFARRSLNRKQIASGSNVPIELTKKDLDTAREKMVGGTEVKDSSGKVIGKTTGKYGGRLSRKAPAPGAGRKPRVGYDDFMSLLQKDMKKSPEERARINKGFADSPSDLGAERQIKDAEKNLKARDTVARQAKVPDSLEDRLGLPPDTFQKRKKDAKPTGGGITDTITRLDRGQQKSAVGAAGGLVAKTFNPALAGVEAMGRYRRGDKKGALISGIQAIGGPIGFGAGVYNALRKQTDVPVTDPNRVRVTGDVSVNPPPTKEGEKVLDRKAKEKGFELSVEKPSTKKAKSKLGATSGGKSKESSPKTETGGGGDKKPPSDSGVGTSPQRDSGGGGTQRNIVSRGLGDAAPLLDYQAFKDAGDSARKALGKIFDPKNLQAKKRTKTGRRSAGS